MKFRLKQGVCVCLGVTDSNRQWTIGVIIAKQNETHYKIAVPYEENPERKRKIQGDFLWCGNILLPEDSLWLLFSRVSSRTFLDWFEQGKVLTNRKPYTVSETQLCEADPSILWKKIYPNG